MVNIILKCKILMSMTQNEFWILAEYDGEWTCSPSSHDEDRCITSVIHHPGLSPVNIIVLSCQTTAYGSP